MLRANLFGLVLFVLFFGAFYKELLAIANELEAQ
jgi:hypothetical protein